MVFNFLKRRRLLIILFSSLLLAGMAARPPLVGGPAPEFELESLKGETVRLADLKGKFVVLNFWATWCVPCIKEIPEFQKAHETLGPDVVILGINFAESRDEVEAYVKEHGMTFPILLDRFGNVSQKYEVIHLPVTYFITPDGIIRDKIAGGNVTMKLIEARLRRLM